MSKTLKNGSSENSSNDILESLSNDILESLSNDILKSLSNKSLYKLQTIVCEDIAWDAPVAKQFFLIYWIKLNIQEKEGNFITTKEIYDAYNKDCDILNKKLNLTPSSFYRLIWNSLLTAKIMYVKSQEDGKKGIRGIQFKNTENSSKQRYINSTFY